MLLLCKNINKCRTEPCLLQRCLWDGQRQLYLMPRKCLLWLKTLL